MTATYWNGQEAIARKCHVRVGQSPPGWWCADLEGQVVEAVEVTCAGEVFYLFDGDGSGWKKVTLGFGSPNVSHKSLPGTSVLVGHG
jgi:hypothetical protein